MPPASWRLPSSRFGGLSTWSGNRAARSPRTAFSCAGRSRLTMTASRLRLRWTPTPTPTTRGAIGAVAPPCAGPHRGLGGHAPRSGSALGVMPPNVGRNHLSNEVTTRLNVRFRWCTRSWQRGLTRKRGHDPRGRPKDGGLTPGLQALLPRSRPHHDRVHRQFAFAWHAPDGPVLVSSEKEITWTAV